MDKAKVIAFAKEQGYDSAEFLEVWRGYDVYEPFFDGGEGGGPATIGPPFVILVKGSKIRMSTLDEAFERIQEADE